MARHALRAIPWLFVGLATALIAVLLRVVEEWPYTMWPLQGIAVGLLAAAAARLFDEPAAMVVDTLPRHLAWRTAARGVVALGLVAWWLVVVAWTAPAYFGHAGDVAWQGAAAVLAATAYVTWRRSAGTPTPARAAGTGLVGGAVYLALARPAEDVIVLFPYTEGGPWAESRQWWAAVATVGVVVLAVTLSEADRRRTLAS
ncbi:MAG TPA: hypothetical protein VFO49_15210 [Nocardioides sp.]|nr:hypothetical protein [Nocardioides sp.]